MKIMKTIQRNKTTVRIVFLILCICINSFTFAINKQIESKPLYNNEQFSPVNDFPAENLEVLGEWDINTGEMQNICFYNDLIFATSHEGGLQIFNVSNPYNPKLILSYELDQWLFDVCVRDQYVFLAVYNGLQIFDISNLSSVELCSELTFSHIPLIIDI